MRAARWPLQTDARANGDPWPYGGGTVHHGFFEAFESLRENLETTLALALANFAIKPVCVCGHSLGGALATLIACYLRRVRKTLPVQLYTCGQPRVGTLSFAKNFWRDDDKFSYFRTANALDLVTWVPNIYVCQDANQFAELAKLALRHWAGTKLFPSKNLWLTEAEYLAILKEARTQSATVAKFMAETCSQSHDYRHFGVRVMCGADPDFGSYLLELRQAPSARQVEDELTSRTHRLYDWGALDLAYHGINHTMFDGYLPHMASFFERNARGYLTAGSARQPLAPPALPAAEPRLVQRMLQLNRSNWAPPETGYEVVRRMIDESLGAP